MDHQLDGGAGSRGQRPPRSAEKRPSPSQRQPEATNHYGGHGQNGDAFGASFGQGAYNREQGSQLIDRLESQLVREPSPAPAPDSPLALMLVWDPV